MISTIIADDEAHARERLRELLDRFALFDVVGEAADGTEALSLMVARKPEVAFLDINMPGVSVFSSIPSLQTPPLIVFQTAHAEHAAAAYDISAVDYLLKPVRFERLEKTVAKIKEVRALRTADRGQSEQSAGPAGRLSITVAGKTKVIAPEDIIRISFENGFCCLYTVSERLVSDKYLSYYEEKLKGGPFFRTSRTDIVNLNHIAMIHRVESASYALELKNGMKIELSRRRAQELRTIVDF